MNHPTSTLESSPQIRLELWTYLFLALVTFAVYFQVITFDFIDTDTPYYVYQNLIVRSGLSWDSAYWALTTFDAGNWLPLARITHMLDVELYGLAPGGHHLTSLLLHIVNTLLLFHLLNRMTSAPLRSGLVACLFALHPTHIESVAWVAERKDVLCALFFFLTIRCYLGYVKSPGVLRYFLVFGCYVLALASKPMAITLPCVLLLLDFWPLARIHITAQGLGKQGIMPLCVKGPLARAIYEKIPLLLPTIGSGVLTIKVQQSAGYVESLTKLPLSDRIGNAVVSYISYINKTIWPTDLSFVYPHPGTHPLWLIIVSFVIFLLISFFAVRMMNARPYYITGWCWFLGTLVPVIGIVQVGSQSMADRYTYLPGIGLYIIFAWGLSDILNKTRVPSRKIFIFTSLCIAAVLSLLSCKQLPYWRNSISLYEQSLRVTENNHVMHSSLGYSYMSEKRYAEAERELREALRINKFDAYSYINLSIILVQTGREQEALVCLRNAIKLEPNNHYAHFNMAKLFVKIGKEQEAIRHFETTIRLNPDMPIAYNKLGNLMLQQGKRDEAIAWFQQALRIYPGYKEANDNLRRALSQSDE